MTDKFQIGDQVIVTAVTTMGYDEEGNRKPWRLELDPPQVLIVVGLKRRDIGTYVKGSHDRFDHYSGINENYEGPRLERTGSVWLWQCRANLKAKIVEVADADLTMFMTNGR